MNWYDPLPTDLVNSWLSIYSELKCVKSLSVPRSLICQEGSRLQLHGFSDASTKTLSAVIYLRVLHEDDSVISVVAAKTKVAPVKSLNILD